MTRQMSDKVDGDMPCSSNTIYVKLPVYTNGLTWFVNLLATKHCCCVNLNSKAGENHSLLFNLVDLTLVPNKEMGSYLAN